MEIFPQKKKIHTNTRVVDEQKGFFKCSFLLDLPEKANMISLRVGWGIYISSIVSYAFGGTHPHIHVESFQYYWT